MKVFWTAAALLGALLLQTALTQIAPAHARILDPFLIVIVYCGLTGGEMHGMLAGAAGGWIQDIHFGGTVLGLAGLTKVLLGFAVGVASTRFHLVEALPRGLVLFLATVADALIFVQLAAVFDVASYEVAPARILLRAAVNAAVGVAAYEVVERRGRFRLVRRRA
jgi:rod shape-determining protein MreD